MSTNSDAPDHNESSSSYYRDLEDQLASFTVADLHNEESSTSNKTTSLVLTNLTSSDNGVRYHAIEAAGRLGISDACSHILTVILGQLEEADMDNDIRISACKAARKLVESGNWSLESKDLAASLDCLLDAVARLTKYNAVTLLGGSARVRIAAVKNAGVILEVMKKTKSKSKGRKLKSRTKRGKRNTTGFFDEDNNSVEVRAAKAIVDRFADSDADVRIAAGKALGKLGSKTQKIAVKYAERLQLEHAEIDNASNPFGTVLSILGNKDENEDEESSLSIAAVNKADGNSISYAERIKNAKKRLRPRATSWNVHNTASVSPAYMNPDDVQDNLNRIDYQAVSSEEWNAKRYGERPQVIKGITAHWASKDWTQESLVGKFCNHSFRVGSDENDDDVRLSLLDFAQYLDKDCDGDDNPMYLFDHIGEGPFETMLGYYSIPKYFSPPNDLFSVLDPIDERPPHRWILYGGARSGSAIHKDPLCTSAWNTSLFGRKRWMLFPPESRRVHLLPASNERLWPLRVAGPSAWFEQMLPLIRSSEWRGPQPVEIIQEAGETVYVPNGWWHIVLNLSPAVALTQNLGCHHDFQQIDEIVRRKRPDIYEDWIARVRRQWPNIR